MVSGIVFGGVEELKMGEVLEERITRREMIRQSGIWLSAILPFELEAQHNPRAAFVRGTPYNVDSLPVVQISKERYVPTDKENLIVKERLRILERIAGKTPALKGTYQQLFVKFEPDKNFAASLIREAKKSISDLVRFLGSPYISMPHVSFSVPGNADEVRINNANPFLIYLVAELKVERYAEYSIEGVKGPVLIKFGYSSAGESFRSWIISKSQEGIDIFQNETRPIFYPTTKDIAKLVDIPPAEVLHQLVAPYTLMYAKAAVRPLKSISDAEYNLINSILPREEPFVHALVYLWRKEYLRKVGLKQEDIEQSTGFLKHDPKYAGTIELSRHIERIGVQRAIEMYVKNPDALFKGITN